MGSVGRVSGAEACVVHRYDDRAVLLRHGRHGVGVVGVGQMLLGVQVRRQHQGLAITAGSADQASATVSHGVLVTAPTAPTQIER